MFLVEVFFRDGVSQMEYTPFDLKTALGCNASQVNRISIKASDFKAFAISNRSSLPRAPRSGLMRASSHSL